MYSYLYNGFKFRGSNKIGKTDLNNCISLVEINYTNKKCLLFERRELFVNTIKKIGKTHGNFEGNITQGIHGDILPYLKT